METRKRPCDQCPWRRDVPAGQFPAERYVKLRETTGERGAEAAFDAPLFGCHKSTDEHELPCAGWLAAVGYDSIRVRMLLAAGEIPMEAMDPGDDWPPLFDSYREMAATQGGDGPGESFCLERGCRAFGQPQTVTPGYPCPTCGRGTMKAIERRTR